MDIRDELEKYREEGRFITEVFRERQVAEEFERLDKEEKLKELRSNNDNIIINKPRKGRFL